MRTVRSRWLWGAGSGACLLGVLLAPATAPARDTIRIYEDVGKNGRPILVLTNLDENGNRIVDPDAPRDLSPPAAVPSGPLCEDPPPRARTHDSEAPTPPPVFVTVVNAPVLAAPVYPVGWGSIVGGYRYPDRQPFLGYGPGIFSPGWFSGLGLNASNNFGHPPSVRTDRTGRAPLPGPSR